MNSIQNTYAPKFMCGEKVRAKSEYWKSDDVYTVESSYYSDKLLTTCYVLSGDKLKGAVFCEYELVKVTA